MTDALRALVDAVGLDVRYGDEVLADDDRWTLDLGATDSHVWVASSARTEVWIRRDDDVGVVVPGTAALVAPGATVTIGAGPDRSAPPSACDDWPAPTGVHWGTATFGPFVDEALGLAPSLRTEPLGAPCTDVVLALAHLRSLVAGRWHAAHRDALARVVVMSVVEDNPPAFLRDASLTRCIDRLLDSAGPVPIDDLRRGTGLSASTVLRRFRATTGCSPDELWRWFRSLPVRAALAAADADPAVVAADAGFSTTGSMRRSLRRVRAPEVRVPPAL
ncbi:helix-turn-helix domain-containing protein [Curtobacterium sp. B18]|uniref:helix-turn-helix domain-containing protein n=1 Tax=Curtobacterium sp. B18 TaxID=95614 RepID=UPI00034851B3|nr:helix-turn-helix domain-containing protein [Curtobacterium sp. B18]